MGEKAWFATVLEAVGYVDVMGGKSVDNPALGLYKMMVRVEVTPYGLEITLLPPFTYSSILELAATATCFSGSVW